MVRGVERLVTANVAVQCVWSVVCNVHTAESKWLVSKILAANMLIGLPGSSSSFLRLFWLSSECPKLADDFFMLQSV